MNKVILITLMLFSLNGFTASVTVAPFDLRVLVDTSHYDLEVELTMACRYEKLVISDSAEYEYKHLPVKLQIKEEKLTNGLSEVRIINSKKRILEQTEWYRSNKGCQTYFELFLKDKIYTTGFFNEFSRPIRLGFLEHSRVKEVSEFDLNWLFDTFNNKKLSFNYKNNGYSVNTRFALDDISTTELSTFLYMNVALDEETGMPYRLQTDL